MDQFKRQIVNKMTAKTNFSKVVYLKDAAKEIGIKSLSKSDCEEIAALLNVNGFSVQRIKIPCIRNGKLFFGGTAFQTIALVSDEFKLED